MPRCWQAWRRVRVRLLRTRLWRQLRTRRSSGRVADPSSNLTRRACDPPINLHRDSNAGADDASVQVDAIRSMFVLIVGAGRVGSAVAKSALAAGHEVSVLDEDPLSHERLDAGQSGSWEESDGQFTVGTALETEALVQAGIERADVFIASTDGDNTNLIIAQIAQRRFGVQKVLVRVMDPARAGWYGEQGLHTISPTKHAIEMFESALAAESA
ncbi:MAG TPA: TrkA family potassium uptake protein [Solirubrobacteraceae bacterium]|nr:TrkA family potassium uptake protein [Solirubrobacteraceae bacterium]